MKMVEAFMEGRTVYDCEKTTYQGLYRFEPITACEKDVKQKYEDEKYRAKVYVYKPETYEIDVVKCGKAYNEYKSRYKGEDCNVGIRTDLRVAMTARECRQLYEKGRVRHRGQSRAYDTISFGTGIDEVRQLWKRGETVTTAYEYLPAKHPKNCENGKDWHFVRVYLAW